MPRAEALSEPELLRSSYLNKPHTPDQTERGNALLNSSRSAREGTEEIDLLYRELVAHGRVLGIQAREEAPSA